jgi:hypothetical protein
MSRRFHRVGSETFLLCLSVEEIFTFENISVVSLQENGSSGMETRSRDVNPDTERLHQRLRDIAQAVITDDDSFFDDYDTGRTSPRRVSPDRGYGR